MIRRSDNRYRLPVAIDSTSAKPDQYVVWDDIAVELFDSRCVIVPAGFVTDCHSTPPWLQSLLPAYNSRTALAAIVHDYLYMQWEQTSLIGAGPYEYDWEPPGYNNREYADRCYFELMQQFAPHYWRNRLYWLAVRLFGLINWNKFRRQNADKPPHYATQN